MSPKHYRHLQEHFYHLICNKVLEAGSKLPSEREISEQFKLTRVTVRQALQNLEVEGLIYRQNRRGWFVSPPAVVYDPAAHLSFNLYVTEQGCEPYTQKLEQVVQPACAVIGALMGVEQGTPVLLLRRLRYIDQRPVLVEKMYINISLLPGIEEEDLSQSLSQLLRKKYHMSYRDMDLSFRSAALPEEATKALGVAAGQSGLSIERINYTSDKQVLEVDYEYWRHDAVAIQIAIRD